MADGFVTLNPGAGGEVMDESAVFYPGPPTVRLRSRVVVSGETPGALAQVIDYDPIGTECGLVTRPIFSSDSIISIKLPGISIVNFDEITSISDNTETTIVSFIVPVSSTFGIVGFVGSGDIEAKYSLKVDGITKLVARSTSSSPTIELSFQLAHPLAVAGQTVALRVEHFQVPLSGDFEGTILGFLT
jgi:hypothetical protein